MRALLSILILLLTQIPTRSAEVRTSEHQLKAAFLFNFAQFVEWPTNAFQNESDPIVIGVLGADPFGETLDKLAAGEVVRGRPLKIVRFSNIADCKNAHILFVAKGFNAQWPEVMQALRDAPTLTVGDFDRFAARGGMIHLVTDRNLVRMRVNAEAARKADLVISSKLLRLAEQGAGEGKP